MGLTLSLGEWDERFTLDSQNMMENLQPILINEELKLDHDWAFNQLVKPSYFGAYH
ncbi:MAG: hypothetical protein IPN86_15725 [Saprospiraceae bacterium]|nr:hypothetical protein [Saprospiraceae bacterium]